jgi:hypothetical protein
MFSYLQNLKISRKSKQLFQVIHACRGLETLVEMHGFTEYIRSEDAAQKIVTKIFIIVSLI